MDSHLKINFLLFASKGHGEQFHRIRTPPLSETQVGLQAGIVGARLYSIMGWDHGVRQADVRLNYDIQKALVVSNGIISGLLVH